MPMNISHHIEEATPSHTGGTHVTQTKKGTPMKLAPNELVRLAVILLLGTHQLSASDLPGSKTNSRPAAEKKAPDDSRALKKKILVLEFDMDNKPSAPEGSSSADTASFAQAGAAMNDKLVVSLRESGRFAMLDRAELAK